MYIDFIFWILVLHGAALSLAACCFVHTQILINPDHIFGNAWKWVKEKLTRKTVIIRYKKSPGMLADKFTDDMSDDEKDAILTDNMISTEHEHPHWILKPLGDCIYCFSGQLALWIYLIACWNNYNFFEHIIYILLTIFYAKVVMQLFNK